MADKSCLARSYFPSYEIDNQWSEDINNYIKNEDIVIFKKTYSDNDPTNTKSLIVSTSNNDWSKEKLSEEYIDFLFDLWMTEYFPEIYQEFEEKNPINIARDRYSFILGKKYIIFGTYLDGQSWNDLIAEVCQEIIIKDLETGRKVSHYVYDENSLYQYSDIGDVLTEGEKVFINHNIVRIFKENVYHGREYLGPIRVIVMMGDTLIYDTRPRERIKIEL